VIKPVRVSKDGAVGELRPYQHGFRVEAEIEFDHPMIGKSSAGARHRAQYFSQRDLRARALSVS
jgi:UDP-3-O-[3-hydroxymyristoyl] N-acetylglucosamine deacetylase